MGYPTLPLGPLDVLPPAAIARLPAAARTTAAYGPWEEGTVLREQPGNCFVCHGPATRHDERLPQAERSSRPGFWTCGPCREKAAREGAYWPPWGKTIPPVRSSSAWRDRGLCERCRGQALPSQWDLGFGEQWNGKYG